MKDLENELTRAKDESKTDKQKLEQELEKAKEQNYQSETELGDIKAEIQRLKEEVNSKDKQLRAKTTNVDTLSKSD